MSVFERGDRVRYKYAVNPVLDGTVVEVWEDGHVTVRWDHGLHDSIHVARLLPVADDAPATRHPEVPEFRRRVIYLGGPMRGRAQFNFPAFEAARNDLRAQGHIVICPAERDVREGFDPRGFDGSEDLARIGFSLEAALYDCFNSVLMADSVALLPGWEQSEGARAEALVAKMTGRDLFTIFPSQGHRLHRIDVKLTTKVEQVIVAGDKAPV